MQEESSLNCSITFVLKLLRTLDAFALEKRELERAESHYITKVHHSTELLLNSWHKVETSLLKMELEVSLSMAQNSKMKISLPSTLLEEIFQWQMQDQTQMDLNSS
mgnify:CR=1 FL=1